MITLHQVSKRYVVEKGVPKWVLHDVSLRIPAGVSTGVIGRKHAGKSTLLRLVTGQEAPTEGRIERGARINFPTRYMRNMQPLLTGRQNARFICRVSGYADDLEETIARIEQFARLGSAFDTPVRGYKATQKARLSFALSWVFDADVYVADAFNFAGDAGFGDKAVAERELQRRAGETLFLMAGAGKGGDAMLRKYCQAGIWVHDTGAQWFDRVGDALEAARAAEGGDADASASPGKAAREPGRTPDGFAPAVARLRKLQNAMAVLARGLGGAPSVVESRHVARLLKVGKDIGLDLASRERLAELGLEPVAGAQPVLKAAGPEDMRTDYFDANTQTLPRSGAGGLAVASTEE